MKLFCFLTLGPFYSKYRFFRLQNFISVVVIQSSQFFHWQIYVFDEGFFLLAKFIAFISMETIVRKTIFFIKLCCLMMIWRNLSMTYECFCQNTGTTITPKPKHMLWNRDRGQMVHGGLKLVQ